MFRFHRLAITLVIILLATDVAAQTSPAKPTVNDPGTIEVIEDNEKAFTIKVTTRDKKKVKLEIVKNPAHGSFTKEDLDSGEFTYKPKTNYIGADSFTVKAKEVEDDGVESDEREIAIRVKRDDERLDELLEKVDSLTNTVEHLKANDEVAGRSIRCNWADGTCDGDDVEINAGTMSTIQIHGLPHATAGSMKVVASTGEIEPTALSSSNPKVHTRVFAKGEAPDTITVDLHKTRRFLRDYGNRATFLAERDSAPQERLALLVKGDTTIVKVQVAVHTPKGEVSAVKTFSIPLSYDRWFLDAGGSFLFTGVVDQEIVTEPVMGSSEVKVTAMRDADSLGTDTAVMFHFVPGNYQSFSMVSFGVSSQSGRSPSFFLGSGVRFRSQGRRSLLSISAGIAAVQALRFPDLSVGSTYSTDASALKGRNEYKTGAYLGFTLGFSIGGGSTPSGSASVTNGS